ncbi:hypothetical protein LCM10_16655 [Rossellomorea aquimaris]|uniref:hypothetical protein n=1 Tax=Rossellomorea aquimaris TaxID=189382 RepID=UPI001CD78F3F|nr:hypothetical protein [Rossellomorea aquimaris]MCA1056615.1 hypothetical protein [Rossellomorea aquimaris]
MSIYIILLTLIAVAIAGYSIYYTFRVAGQEKRLKGEFDTDIPDAVKQHPYIRNPVFLAVLLFSAFVVVMILYLSFKFAY